MRPSPAPSAAAPTILTPAERAALFDPPHDHDEAVWRCSLAADDVALASRRRRPQNRLGFAVQLTLVRDLGRTLRAGEQLPPAVIDVVADQLGADPEAFDLYAGRDETRREHAAEIAALLGLRTIAQADYRAAIAVGAAVAAATERGVPIVTGVVEHLKSHCILVPRPALVERLALAGRAQARREAHRALARGLDGATRAALQALLTERAEGGDRTVFGWIGEAPEGPTQRNLTGAVERLRRLRAIAVPDERRHAVHANRYGLIAREAKVTSARELLKLREERRMAVLVVFVIERRAALTDLGVEMWSRMIAAAHRRAEASREARRLARAEALEVFARNHLLLCWALEDARREGRDLAGAVEGSLGWDRVADDARVLARGLGPSGRSDLEELIARRVALRRASRVLFEAFVLRSFKPGDPILAAVGILRSLYAGERRALPAKVPVVFLKRRWRDRVRAGTPDFDPRAWEVAVLVHLRDRLRSGDVWVEGSRAFRTFEDYLLPRPVFAAMRAEGRLGLAVPDDFQAWRAERVATLDAKLSALATAAAADRLPDATIDAGGLTLSPIRRERTDEHRRLSARLYALMPRIRITDLLAEVDGWTGFASCFTHYRTGQIPPDGAPALMGAILADATNMGLERMAESSRGLTIHELGRAIDERVRPETYAAAIAAIVDAQHAHPLSAIWGPGETSSSDGQFFAAGGWGAGGADYNARHGAEPGSVFYGFISDRFASFYSKVIPAAASEAPHVLDGLVHNEAALAIQEHATDTAGAVEAVFALFHLLGFRFAPRIRDLSDRRLFTIDRGRSHGVLDPTIAGPVSMSTIEENWDELLRLAASIRAGTVQPSVILKKIAAFPRQNALNKTLREIGRVERSVFMADWLMEPALRRRSNANLNKGESRHALARAVFFHRLGELRDRTAETLAYRASGLNLVVNAIILWNTTYLARAVAYVRSQGIELPDEDLAHVAPIRWGHIALTGDYLWTELERPQERFRPLRTRRFDPTRFAGP